MTEVPNGHLISELPRIDPRDYVRLYSTISTSNNSNLPSLWVFLVIVIGILLVMLAGTSAAMHLIQRARRNSLRRRIQSGEVDLEALGIKRLTIPQELIDKCPLFTYNCEDEKTSRKTTNGEPDNAGGDHRDPEEILEADDALQNNEPLVTSVDELDSNRSSLAHTFLPYSQPTCPICLDDFKSGITPIRELPCGHIFHPDCIDSFLSNNSSLCPMCKKSVLPQGYCLTPITNSIVRRERNLRRLRSRVTINDEGGVQNAGNRMQRLNNNLRGIFQLSATTRPSPDRLDPIPLEPRPALVAEATTLNPRASVLGNEVFQVQDGVSRSQIARRRIRELASSQPTELQDEGSDNLGPGCTLPPISQLEDTANLAL